jgi:hypothetical protein
MEYLSVTYVGNCPYQLKCLVWKGKGVERKGRFKSTPAGIQFVDE